MCRVEEGGAEAEGMVVVVVSAGDLDRRDCKRTVAADDTGDGEVGVNPECRLWGAPCSRGAWLER